MVAMIGELDAVERSVREADIETLRRVRAKRSAPILTRMRRWLDKAAGRGRPLGLLGQAIGYALNQWSTLVTFLDDGGFSIDNNRAQNAIRPFVVGRKGWLFAGSPDGADASALLYSLVETATANALEPWTYLNHLFLHLSNAKSPAAIEALLPHRVTLDDIKS